MKLLFETETFLIIEKPAPLPSLPKVGKSAPTLASKLLEEFPELEEIPEHGIVHRLDNETSGIVVVALTLEMYQTMRRLFARGEVEKHYRALVIGNTPIAGRIETPIAHHPRKKKKMVVCDTEERIRLWKGRPAVTHYQSQQHFITPQGGVYSLLEISIATGVRHQIRAHLASIGHPLAGDRLYQSPKKRALDDLPLTRHFLHASFISFQHPLTGERVECVSDFPDELQCVLAEIDM